MPAALTLLIAVIQVSPAIAMVDHGQGLSRNQTAPFGEFDLTAIGITLVVVMVILGIRAITRRRP